MSVAASVVSQHSFAGNFNAFNTSFVKEHMDSVQVVDTGAIDHMSSKKHIFQSVTAVTRPVTVLLPNENYIQVTKKGNVSLAPSVLLADTLYIPDITYNLLSVSKLLSTTSLILHFNAKRCLFQDQRANKVVALGKDLNGLYILDSNGFLPSTIDHYLSLLSSVNTILSVPHGHYAFNKESICSSFTTCKYVDYSMLHTRLSHASFENRKDIDPNIVKRIVKYVLQPSIIGYIFL